MVTINGDGETERVSDTRNLVLDSQRFVKNYHQIVENLSEANDESTNSNKDLLAL